MFELVWSFNGHVTCSMILRYLDRWLRTRRPRADAADPSKLPLLKANAPLDIRGYFPPSVTPQTQRFRNPSEDIAHTIGNTRSFAMPVSNNPPLARSKGMPIPQRPPAPRSVLPTTDLASAASLPRHPDTNQPSPPARRSARVRVPRIRLRASIPPCSAKARPRRAAGSARSAGCFPRSTFRLRRLRAGSSARPRDQGVAVSPRGSGLSGKALRGGGMGRPPRRSGGAPAPDPALLRAGRCLKRRRKGCAGLVVRAESGAGVGKGVGLWGCAGMGRISWAWRERERLAVAPHVHGSGNGRDSRRMQRSPWSFG